MDPVKEETPITNADQDLVEKTGGIHGEDNSGHADAAIGAVAGELGEPVKNITPEAKLAENNLGEIEKVGFLKDVAGVQEAGDLKKKDESSNSSLDLSEWRQNVGAHLPQIGEDTSGNDREMPSKEANVFELERQEKMKKAA